MTSRPAGFLIMDESPAKVGDSELDALLSSEQGRLLATPIIPSIIQAAQNFDQQKFLDSLSDAYVSVGGDLDKLSRIVQIRIDNRVTQYLATINLPGPDTVIIPFVRKAIVDFVAKEFDALFRHHD